MRMLSTIASGMRGSVGGLTFSANQFHQIIVRQRTAPVNPNTTYQSMMRGAFGDAQSLYEALSEGNKLAWDAYADTLTYEGPLGNNTIPGRQVCLGNVATALYLDDRGIDVDTVDASPPPAPGFLSLADLDVGAPTQVGTGFSVNFRNNNPEDIVVYAQRSIPFNTGRKRYKGPFLSESLDSVEIIAANSGVIDFLNCNEDSVYFAVVRAISAEPPYRMCRPFFVRAVAQTTVI